MVIQQVLTLDSLTEPEFREQICEYGYVSIASPRPVDFKGNYGKFSNFLQLRPEILHEFKEDQRNGTPGSEVGYIAKGREMRKDPKRLFHYHPAMYDEFNLDALLNTKSGVQLKQNERTTIVNYLESQFELWTATWEIHQGIIRALEPRFPGLMKRFVNAAHPTPELYRRDLAYDDVSDGEISAKHHLDNGNWFTTALYETAPGLHILNPKSGPIPLTNNLPLDRYKDMIPIEEHLGQFVVFPGRNINTFLQTDYVPPGWHGVIRQPHAPYQPREMDLMYNRGIGRGASVAFLNECDFVQENH